jgi:hypothetical protein
MQMSSVEIEFLLISGAVTRLEAGMFGGAINRPEPVEVAKKIYPRASIGSGLQKEKAAEVVNVAIMSGDLTIYVLTQPTADRSSQPLPVPIDVLQRLIKAGGGLPDHAIRLPFNLLRIKAVTPELFAALSNSAMFVREAEFEAWYQRQKRRRRWPSQVGSKKPRIGRPSKQTDELLTSIRARAAENSWSGRDGIAPLVKLLKTNGAPNRNTVRRAVQLLFEETGDPAYRIVARKRAKAKPLGSQT